MKGSFSFRDGIDGERQMAHFQNATQITLGKDQRSLSIAVTPVFPKGFDVLDARAVEAFLADAVQPLVDAGFVVDVQYGPFQA